MKRKKTCYPGPKNKSKENSFGHRPRLNFSFSCRHSPLKRPLREHPPNFKCNASRTYTKTRTTPLYVEAGLSTLLTAGVTCRLRVASGLTFSTFDSDRKSQSGSAGRSEGSKRTDTTILLKLAQAGKADIHEMLLAGFLLFSY